MYIFLLLGPRINKKDRNGCHQRVGKGVTARVEASEGNQDPEARRSDPRVSAAANLLPGLGRSAFPSQGIVSLSAKRRDGTGPAFSGLGHSQAPRRLPVSFPKAGRAEGWGSRAPDRPSCVLAGYLQ